MFESMKDKEKRLLLRFAKARTVKLSEPDDSESDNDKRHMLDSSGSSDSFSEEQMPPEDSLNQEISPNTM